MINYSLYPAEMVFEGWDDFTPEYRIFKVQDDLSLMVEKIGEGRYRIEQVISSDPMVFFETGFYPG